MKILVCTDGSEQSLKAVNQASKIAEGCGEVAVTLIYVYERKASLTYGSEVYLTGEVLERLKEAERENKAEYKEILEENAKVFKDKNMKVTTALKEGHPAETIAEFVAEENFELVVIGSRGMSGVKKMFLGSVSNAVLQEVKANVLVVK